MSKKSKIILAIVIILLCVILFFGLFGWFKKTPTITIYGAIDESRKSILTNRDFLQIANSEFLILNDLWSREDLIKNTVVREDSTPYDFIYFSDFNVLNRYQASEHHKTPLDTKAIFNTPLVVYSFDIIVDELMKKNIVREVDNVYYIIDIEQLMSEITKRTTWKELGIDLHGSINILTPNPVTTDLGQDYYSLLFSVLKENKTESNDTITKQLIQFMKSSSYRTETPKELFELYVRAGVSAVPMMIGYERDIVEFAQKNDAAVKQLKDHMRILYPIPTLYHSSYLSSFTDHGNSYLKLLEKPNIQQLAWSHYGIRTEVGSRSYDVSISNIPGIPGAIRSLVPPLEYDTKTFLLERLEQK